ncbi:MAG: hypothetical protein O3A00_25730, partial [Planctomycetota bacterium]|nr:hypothetical protein [Planctomycetota bacterium]
KQLKSLHIVDVRDDLMRERRKQRYREVFQVYDNVNKDRNRVWIGEFDDGAKTFFDEFISDPENAIKTNSWESLQDYVK